MSRSRFFQVFKSTRGLFLLIFGFTILAVFGYTAYRTLQELFRERPAFRVVNTDTNSNAQEQMSLGIFEQLNGTPYLIANISSQQNYRQSYYDNSAVSSRNFLFFNTSNKSAQRLVPKNDFLFLRYGKLGKQIPQSGVMNNVRGIWYELVTADSNNDKRLTGEDLKTIAVSDVSGANYTEVIRQVDRVLGTYQPDEATFLIFYASGEKNFVTEINVLTRQTVVTEELPSIK